MSPKTPEPLAAQALALAEAAAAGARWFREPGAEALTAAATARLRARSWRTEAVAASKGARGPVKTDAADMSYALREAVENAAAALADAERWGAGADARFAAMYASLRDGAKALARAAGARGRDRAEALVEAKRWAADVERRRLGARRAAQDSPFFVDSIKQDELASRLSASAEALQQACDALAGSLAE
ncbi:MAG: hypothetical protein HY079_10505 [Elusimicrobia bacterium]|nr:hypothetical protein [Elusimicrobiota bacterium]